MTGVEASARIKEVGREAFYRECLEMCDFAMDLLGSAELCDEVRFVWRPGDPPLAETPYDPEF